MPQPYTPVVIPELVTKRLRMCALQPHHFDAYAAMFADPEVMKFLSGVKTRHEAWRYFAMQLGHWQLRGFGMWAVELQETGEFLGRVGLHEPEGWPGIEVGWALTQQAQGHGYATEAAKASFEWGFANVPVDRLLSLVAPDNAASKRVCARLGQVDTGTVEVCGHTVHAFALSRPE